MKSLPDVRDFWQPLFHLQCFFIFLRGGGLHSYSAFGYVFLSGVKEGQRKVRQEKKMRGGSEGKGEWEP